MKKIHIVLTSFFTSVILLLSFPVVALADTTSGYFPSWSEMVENEDGSVTYKPVVKFTPAELFDYMKQTLSFGLTQAGCWLSGTAQELVLNWEAFCAWEEDRYADGYDGTAWNSTEYFTKEVTRNSDGTFTISDRAMDDFVAYTKEILDTNCGYYLINTVSAKNVEPSKFYNKTLYEYFNSLLDEYEIIAFSNISGGSTSINWFPLDGYYFVSEQGSLQTYYIYNSNWEKITYQYNKHTEEEDTLHGTLNSNLWHQGPEASRFIASKDGGYIKVFKSVADMKNYSVGYQPYYASSQFAGYDENADNALTVAGDYFMGNDWTTTNNNYYNNSSTTIINNYGNSMTDEQLQQLIDTMLEQFKNEQNNSNNGNSGGSSGSGGSGGSGLGSVLDGLGSLGDALLSIVGKLLEYVGKAVEMITSIITKIIDVVPTNVTSLFTALFPFIPEELLVPIELMLVLSVILIIVKAFK